MPHVAGGKFPASTIRSSAFAVAPGASVTSSRGGVGFSFAERPIWPPDDPAAVDPSLAPGGLWAESIEDAAGVGGLSLSSAGRRGDERVGPTPPVRIATLGHGDGVDDLDGFDHASRRAAHTHVAVSPTRAAPTGRTPPDVIQRIVRESFGHLQLCYEAGLRRHPRLAGRIAVKFIIDRQGAVAMATDAGSDLLDADVVACVVRAFDALTFPASMDSATTVVYPVVFTPG